jgi:dihydropyrimidinase
MALLIKNGEIVTVGAKERADIFVEDETITRIGRNLEAPPGTETIDASGKLVFPGFIDPHVHIYLPFMATFAKDTHETGSIAATTTRCRDMSFGSPKPKGRALAIMPSTCRSPNL